VVLETELPDNNKYIKTLYLFNISNEVNRNITKSVNKLTPKNTLNINSSNLICIKIFITKIDLTAAIERAIKRPVNPTLKPAIATVIEVKAIKATHTIKYVVYGVI